MRGEDSVSAHGCGGAVVDGGVEGVEGGFAPVLVGLVAGVGAFGAQGLFVGPEEIAVPGEEVGGAVDGEGLVDVHGDEVVVAGSCARGGEGGGDGEFGYEAFDGRGVGYSLVAGEGGPGIRVSCGCKLRGDLEKGLTTLVGRLR